MISTKQELPFTLKLPEGYERAIFHQSQRSLLEICEKRKLVILYDTFSSLFFISDFNGQSLDDLFSKKVIAFKQHAFKFDKEDMNICYDYDERQFNMYSMTHISLQKDYIKMLMQVTNFENPSFSSSLIQTVTLKMKYKVDCFNEKDSNF